MVAKSTYSKPKRGVRAGGVTKRRGAKQQAGGRAVHGDVGNEYEYDLEAGIDIGAIGDNVMLAGSGLLGSLDTSHPVDTEDDDVEDIIDVNSERQAEDEEDNPVAGGEGEAQVGTVHDIRALLDDFDRQEGMETKDRGASGPPPSARCNLSNTIYDRVPWDNHACLTLRSPTLRLHEEIRMFNGCLRPTEGEQRARNDAVARIREVVAGLWPESRLEVFGSFATGLYLPSSDIDAVILGSKCADIRQGLRVLAKSLSKKSLAVEVQTILKARVPIIKFVERESRFAFDISFDVANGPEAAEIVLRLVDVMPAMSHLVMVLKVFLQQRELSEVYTGGIGSYALLVMVANFILTHGSRFSGREKDTNLGELLIDFFRLHGRGMAQSVGQGVEHFFKKRQLGFHQPDRPELYAVQDPHDESNDLGKNSYNASKVRVAFDHAYTRLTASVKPGESLLERIVRLDKLLFSRFDQRMHGAGGVVVMTLDADEEEVFVRTREFKAREVVDVVDLVDLVDQDKDGDKDGETGPSALAGQSNKAMRGVGGKPKGKRKRNPEATAAAKKAVATKLKATAAAKKAVAIKPKATAAAKKKAVATKPKATAANKRTTATKKAGAKKKAETPAKAKAKKTPPAKKKTVAKQPAKKRTTATKKAGAKKKAETPAKAKAKKTPPAKKRKTRKTT